MYGLADLLRPTKLEDTDGQLPPVMVGKVADSSPLRVTVPALDGGGIAHSAFGTFPDAAAGDEVRVMLDEFGGLVIVAWQAAS